MATTDPTPLSRAGELAFEALRTPRAKASASISWERRLTALVKRPVRNCGTIDIIQGIEAGFPGLAVDLAEDALDLSQSDFAALLDTTEKTVRALKGRKTLDLTTSEKVYRLMKAYMAAYLLFGTANDAVGWLKEPSDALGGQVPLDLLTTAEGEALVHYEIGQMEYGHPA